MKVPGILQSTRNQGIIAAVVVVLLVGTYLHLERTAAPASISTTPAATSTSSLVAASGVTISSTTSATSSQTQTATTTTSVATAKPASAGTPVALVTSAPVSASTASARQLGASGAALLKSLVNIVCVSDDPSIPSISGSGVIIDSRGIILTAAHVAQFFLLQDYLGTDKVQCLVRAGSPARRAYLAEPIYVSPRWVNANLTTLSEAAPKGTGENDFALLAITATATSTPLPNSYPAISLGSGDPTSGERVAIGSYGAQYLTSSELNYSLYPILVFGTIQNLYTFATNTLDLFSVTGSAASQEGSSGGGILNANGQLIGVITTSSVGGDISTRSLNAISIDHIRRSYSADTGNSLDSVLASESISTLVANFAQESKNLGAKLVQNL